MSSEEFEEAQSQAHEWANEHLGNDAFWDLNAMWKDFLEFSKLLGYAGAWLPKDLWLEMMQGLRKLWSDLNQADGFQQRLRICRLYYNNVVKAMRKWNCYLLERSCSRLPR